MCAMSKSSKKYSFPSFVQFSSTFNRCQPFSLPNSIIYYIAKNPSSSKVYQKLIQSCKYFFIRNPILVIDSLSYNDCDGWNFNFELFKLKNISAKIWITFQLKISASTQSSSIADELIPKLFRCDVSILELKNVVVPSEAVLTKSVKMCCFRNVTVLSQNGTEMPLEIIISNLPSLFGFKCTFGPNSINVSSKTVKGLLKIPHFNDILFFGLVNISENFDIETCFNYIKKNDSPKFDLKYSNPLSIKYQNKLEEIVDEILETKSLNYDPPFISFPFQNHVKLAALRKLYKK